MCSCMGMYMWVHMLMEARRWYRIPLRGSCPPWVPGGELRSSANSELAVNRSVTSPAPRLALEPTLLPSVPSHDKDLNWSYLRNVMASVSHWAVVLCVVSIISFGIVLCASSGSQNMLEMISSIASHFFLSVVSGV